MKVAIVINASWNIYNFRRGVIKAILDNGDEVVAIAPKDEFSQKLVELGCDFIPVTMDTQGVNPIRDLKLCWQLRKLYRQVNPDVVLHYTIKPNIYGSLAAYFAKVPSINNVSGLGTVFIKKNLLSWISKWLYRIAFRFPQKIFFQNNDDRQLFLDHRLVKKEKTDLLPGSGVNLDFFRPAPFHHPTPFVFLMISRVIQDKGIREYIEAIRILKERKVACQFQLLGALDPDHKRGISLQEFESWQKEGLFEYLGRTNDVRPFIQDVNCVVLPSYREGTPRTLLEAAAMARPLIATDVPGCREIVKDQINGYLCLVKNSENLANKMEKMVGLNDIDLDKMGKHSRNFVEESFNEKLVIDKYLETIRNFKPD